MVIAIEEARVDDIGQRNIAAGEASGWYLEGFGSEGKTWLIHLKPLPFIVGRQEGCHLRLSSGEISRRHAEIYEQENGIWVRECGSTNGTFVNRERLSGKQILKSGDILHFGSQEFRITRREAPRLPTITQQQEEVTSLAARSLPQGFVNCVQEFDELLRTRAVLPYYQPLIQLSDQSLVGYELLGRGNLNGLPSSPAPLLRIANSLGKEVELSELFREVGVEKALELDTGLQLFFNTVPGEMDLVLLKRSLRTLRVMAPDLPLVMEVHETAVTDLDLMRNLRALLKDLHIKLAYDDFGAGQARLVELMEVPPDVLKFDIMLIRNIHSRSAQSQQVVQTLVTMARDLGIKTLAEGVELPEEVDTCRALGFDYAQGFQVGKPAPSFRARSNSA